MKLGSQSLLVGAVAAVGVLHTLVPDHWVPITVMARQRGWSKSETARIALQAGSGHVVSTLVIAAVVWIAGSAAASHFGAIVDAAASLALIGFGLWISISAWLEQHHHAQSHSHSPVHYTHQDTAGAGSTAAHHQNSRTALLLILGSSPMIEGIPAFFAAGKYGIVLIAIMSVVFAASTILTYVLLCVSSSAGLRHICFGAVERHGEVLSGAAIAIVGLAFWLWPVR